MVYCKLCKHDFEGKIREHLFYHHNMSYEFIEKYYENACNGMLDGKKCECGCHWRIDI